MAGGFQPLGLRKLRSSKKVEILQVVLVLRVELFSTALNCLNAHSTLNFARTFFLFLNITTNQTSKEQDLNFIRSSHLFW